MSRDAAHDEIVRMCNGGSWRMTVPVDDRRDSDIILSRALDELTAERDRARDLAVALEQQVARVGALAVEWDRTANECERLSYVRAGLSDERELYAASLINRRRASDLRLALNPEPTP